MGSRVSEKLRGRPKGSPHSRAAEMGSAPWSILSIKSLLDLSPLASSGAVYTS